MSSPGNSAAAGGEILLRRLQNNPNLPTPQPDTAQLQKLAALLKSQSK